MKHPKKWGENVISAAERSFGVVLTPQQADDLISSSEVLYEDMRACKGHCTDTVTRDYLAQAIVDAVLGDVPCTADDFIADNGWHWPLFGSNQGFREQFFRLFKEHAPKKGFTLTKVWEGLS